MLAPPKDLAAADIHRALRREWGIDDGELEYLPLGFGAHHWRMGSLFVTVHDLRLTGRFEAGPLAGLERTLTAVRRLALPFAVAARPAFDGRSAVGLSPAYALSVYGWRDLRPLEDPDGARAAEMIAELHRVSLDRGELSALPEDFAVRHRAALESALDDVDRRWDTGPYAELARARLVAHQGEVRSALALYDGWVAALREAGRPWPLTHGEPSGTNMAQDAAGRAHMLDWDTATVGPRERDLCELEPAALSRYQAEAGYEPNPAVMRLYRLRYALAETAVYALQFHRPHVEDANMAESWKNFLDFLPTRERWPELMQHPVP